jgi:hypothetical protein
MSTACQLEFQRTRPRRAGTQLEKLRAYLMARPGQWIPMPKLVEVCGSYVIHSRCAEMRRAFKITILNRSSRKPDGICCSEYCYLPGAAPPPQRETPGQVPGASQVQEPAMIQPNNRDDSARESDLPF